MYEMPALRTACQSTAIFRRPCIRTINITSRPPSLRHLSPAPIKQLRLSSSSTSTSTSSSSSSTKPPLHRRPLFHLTIITLSLLAGATYFAMSAGDFISYTDEETLKTFTPISAQQQEVESLINTHSLTRSLRSDPRYTESRPTLKIKETYRNANLTSGVLSGPGKIVVPPFVWSNKEDRSLVSILYIGDELCGYPGVVHGGLLATLLDEGLARCSFDALPNKLGMTANLTINYKKPSLADTFVVLRARCVKVEGRKCWVEGHIETLPKAEGEEPVVLVEASALMVEPKQAKVIKNLISVPVQ